MFTSSKEKTKSKSNFVLPIAAIFALVGGVSAAVLTHPKQKKVRDDLGAVADDLIDSLERILDKVDTGVQKSASHGFGEVSQLIMSAYEEIKTMNNVAVDEPTGMAKVSRAVRHEAAVIKEAATEEIHQVESAVASLDDDISEKIAWLQRKGRNLARKTNPRP